MGIERPDAKKPPAMEKREARRSELLAKLHSWGIEAQMSKKDTARIMEEMSKHTAEG